MELSHTHPRQGGLTMSFSIHGRFREQVRFLRRQFLQDGELPFNDVLSESAVAQALKALDVVWLEEYMRLVKRLRALAQRKLPTPGKIRWLRYSLRPAER